MAKRRKPQPFKYSRPSEPKVYDSGYTNEQAAEARKNPKKVKAAGQQLARTDAAAEPELFSFLESVVTGMDIVPLPLAEALPCEPA